MNPREVYPYLILGYLRDDYWRYELRHKLCI